MRSAVDEYAGTLMRFDFEKPHYPGSLAHELANVRRFDEVQLTRSPGDVGHLVVDQHPHTVYIADTGEEEIELKIIKLSSKRLKAT
jgi:hypothetical protein